MAASGRICYKTMVALVEVTAMKVRIEYCVP